MSIDVAANAALYWLWTVGAPVVYGAAAVTFCFLIVLMLLDYSARIGSR